MATLYSIAPITTPISLFSERASDAGRMRLLDQLRGRQVITAPLELFQPDWPFGYGSVEHDDLPTFFQPVFSARASEPDALESCGADGLELTELELHFYDDCLGVLVLTWQLEHEEPVEGLDVRLTDATDAVYESLVRPQLDALRRVAEASEGPDASLRRPSELAVFRPVEEIPEQTLWVARTAVVPDDQIEPWLRWAGAGEGDCCDLGAARVFVGSGNNVLRAPSGEEGERVLRDYLRAMCLCQFYAALLSAYQSLFQGDLRQMGGVDGDARSTKRVLRSIEHRLDHLAYIHLQHQQAMYGVQGWRRQLCATIHDTWGTAGQYANVHGWAELLRDRVSRHYRAKQVRQNAIIQSLLAFIGGLSLVELSLSLLNESSVHEDDHVPGLLDLFAGAPADLVVYGAIAILCVAMLFVYVSER